MRRTLAIAALAAIAITSAAHADDDPANHCLDQSANSQWATLAKEHHESDTWQRLFALRVGLCAMVHRGDLSVPRASLIFERERKAAIKHFKAAPGKSSKRGA